MIPYFEILEFGNVKKRFQLSLSNISMSNEMMSTPTIDIDGVAELLPYLRGRKEIRIYTENAIFYSNTQSVNVNTNTGVLSISCSHVIKEWEYRQVPTNYATKDKTIPQIYEDDEMKYSNEWIMSFDEKASQEVIDYVYSRQDKLSALTRTCELTPDLFWRVPLTKDKRIEVGVFGEKKNYTVSLRPSGKTNIHILEEPEINEDWSNVINLATVYANKSDSGMSSLSLRELTI